MSEDSVAVATEIASQIPNWLKMALGYRDAKVTETGLRFTVRAGATFLVDVDYDRGSDLYNLTIRTKRKPTYKVRWQGEGLDTEQMFTVLDLLDRGRLAGCR